jgi:hypothetical protein
LDVSRPRLFKFPYVELWLNPIHNSRFCIIYSRKREFLSIILVFQEEILSDHSPRAACHKALGDCGQEVDDKHQHGLHGSEDWGVRVQLARLSIAPNPGQI